MKNKIVGKEINQFVSENNDIPNYFGYNYWPHNEHKQRKVNGQFIAKKYKDILSVIEETKANVTILENCILVNYKNGEIKICRDVLIDTFLLPFLAA